MGRREFITLVSGAVAWPLAVRAQQATGMRRVAFLHPYVENDAEVLPRVIAFRDGLDALGWTENRNIRIEHRYAGQTWAESNPTRRSWCIRHRTSLSEAGRQSPQH